MIATEDSSAPVAIKNNLSQNIDSAIDENAPLKGVHKEEIEMQKVIVGDQGNTFLLHYIVSIYYMVYSTNEY